MIGEIKDLTGRKYGKLTVIEQHGFTEKNKYGSRQAIWYCNCKKMPLPEPYAERREE